MQGFKRILPSDEAQLDRRIEHPIWYCPHYHCGTKWRSQKKTHCPSYCNSYRAGERKVLDEVHLSDLMEAILRLDGFTASWDSKAIHMLRYEYVTTDGNLPLDENEMSWNEQALRDLLQDHARWYDKNCRETIQACYELLLARKPHPRIAFAIAFFKEDYVNKYDHKKMYLPEGIDYLVDWASNQKPHF